MEIDSRNVQKEFSCPERTEGIKKIGPKLQITEGSSKRPANPLSNA